MKKLTQFVGALLLLAMPVLAEEQHVFALNYDLNVPITGATNNAIVTVVNLTNTTLTLAAQPDSPRALTVTIVDTTPSINAGTVTIAGTDVNNAALSEAVSIAGGAAVYTTAGVFRSVTSIIVAGASVLGGAGDETIKVGTSGTVTPIFCVTSNATKQAGYFVKNASSSTTVTAVSPTDAFRRVSAGDLILFSVNGKQYQRTVSSKAANNASIVVNTAINLSGHGTGGYPFSFQHTTCDYSDSAGWTNTTGMAGKMVYIGVNALSGTGGIDAYIECRLTGNATIPSQILVPHFSTAIVPGAPLTTAQDYIPIAEDCDSIRVGFRFTTVDTAGTDSVTAFISGRRTQ